MTTPNLGLAKVSAADTIANALLTKINGDLDTLDTAVNNKVGAGSPIPNLVATTSGAGAVPLIAKGILGQSASLFEARNNVDVALAKVDNTGILYGPDGSSVIYNSNSNFGPRSQGLFANRPVANRAGQRYYATDTDQEFLDDGATWHEILTKTQGNAAYPAIANFPAGAWTAYTPVLGGTGWALGNGSVLGAYRQFGKVVQFRFQITFGSTSTFGSAQLTLSLPVNNLAGSDFHASGVGLVNLTGGTYQVVADFGANVARIWGGAGTLGQVNGVTGTTPSTWVNGTILRMSGTYEAA